ncbi:MAG TPA: efflux RND transporter periplasmic adaptor subunit [Burkholderiaceae bacterium]|nr:efflux RND transporter periplasmic adaptor subunit [Burkholderiaceae bacterium]
MLLKQLRIGSEERDEGGGARSRWWIVGAAVVVLAAVSGAALVALRSQPVAVEVATAAAPASGMGDAAILQATGYVTARRQATVSAQITGTLTQVLIEEGEKVQAGQLLAKLDDTSQRASLAQAEAQLNAAEALVHQYEAQLAQAQSDLKRNEQLADVISQQDIENSRTQVKTIAAQLDSQRRQVEVGRAAVRGAEVQLAYTTVKAPFSGVITAKAAQAGEIVSPMSAGGGFTRTGVGTIVDMDSLEIEVDVNEAYLHRVHPDQPAQALLDAYPDWNIPAHVIAIVPTADRSKATVKVRVAIDHKDPRILPDMGIRVSFLEHSADAAAHAPINGALVPVSAIVERNGKSVVFTVDKERAHAQPVTPGQSFGDLRLVDGVGNGARVVRTPPADLIDGARVSVKG